MVQLSEFFEVSLQKLTYANGATLVCQGVATTIWMYVRVSPDLAALSQL